MRCGLHAGVEEHRDDDFFGRSVNRAARIMGVAHGGQILVSETVASLVDERLSDGVALRDLGLVRLRDLASPERVFQVVHPGLRANFPALRTLEATPNNLPQQLTSFIGREREQAEIATLLARSSLLTLVGAGGIGKTRLSLQVAADLMDEFPDGVWLVELAAIADPRLVPQAVASVLGVKEEPGRPVLEALVKVFKDRRFLVILDNCEHLVQACAELVERAFAIRAAGEAHGVEPRAAARGRGGDLRRAGAGVSRAVANDHAGSARRVRCGAACSSIARLRCNRRSRVTEQNAMALAGVCHQLDGIPLAIELAAARTRALSVENIAARLDDRFRLLKGGDKTALPRQQTLRALIDWSYDLLTEPERMLFCGVSRCSPAGSRSKPPKPSVRRHCRRERGAVAADQSCREVTGRARSGRRALSDCWKRCGNMRRSVSLNRARRTAVRTRHLEHYRDLAEEARPKLAGPAQGAWLARLDSERENLLSAHAWCDRVPAGAESGLRLAHLLKPYWIIRGLSALGHRMTNEALARPGAQNATSRDAKRCFDLGQFDCFMGRYDEALDSPEEGLAIAREIGDKPMVAALLQPLGVGGAREWRPRRGAQPI